MKKTALASALVVATAVVPLAIDISQAGQVWRIGYLTPIREQEATSLTRLRGALRELGESQTVRFM